MEHHFYLHDGRARTFEEAILWHGGEAEQSKQKFTGLSTDRQKCVDTIFKITLKIKWNNHGCSLCNTLTVTNNWPICRIVCSAACTYKPIKVVGICLRPMVLTSVSVIDIYLTQFINR